MKIHLYHTIRKHRTTSFCPRSIASFLLLFLLPLSSDRFVLSLSHPHLQSRSSYFFHPHKSRLFVVLIGILRATHIQTKHKRIDDGNGNEQGVEDEQQKNSASMLRHVLTVSMKRITLLYCAR